MSVGSITLYVTYDEYSNYINGSPTWGYSTSMMHTAISLTVPLENIKDEDVLRDTVVKFKFQQSV